MATNKISLNPTLDAFRSEIRHFGIEFDSSEEFRNSILVFHSRKRGMASDCAQWCQRAVELHLLDREPYDPIEALSDLMCGINRVYPFL